MRCFLALASFATFISGVACAATSTRTTIIPHDHPLLFYHGRWDTSPGTWWAGSGFKLHARGLTALTLNLGPHSTAPTASIGVSVDYAPFVTVNVSTGANAIPLPPRASVVRINVEGWQNNRINLESLTVNSGATLLPYTPAKLAFQFVGDSLSAGQFLPQGVDQAWPFLTGERFRAEHVVTAQPGAALSDIVSYGNEHGLSYEFFRTEDDGYFYTTDHNFTTPWDFGKDHPAPTHVVVHIGANDAAQNVTAPVFVETFTTFLTRIRAIYPYQPFFVFTSWGWPNADGTFGLYYTGQYETIVNNRHIAGDNNVFLVNTTGWVTFADVFPDNQHPNVAGHTKIAGLFQAWLEDWGLRPQSKWTTPV